MSNRDAKFFNPKDLAEPKRGVVKVTTEAQFNELLANAKGAVVVDFVQQGCPACDESKPLVNKLAKSCGDVTIARVDVDQLPELTDRFPKVNGTPTTLYAPTAAQFTPEEAEEVDPGDKEFTARLKCALPVRGDR